MSRLSRLLERKSIIVVSASVPFSSDPPGHRAAALADALRRDGRSVAVVDLPVSDRPEDAHDQRVAIEALDLSDSCGTLVCLGHPTFLLSHANKRVWLTDALPPLEAGELAALRAATRVVALDPGASPAETARRLIG